MSLRFLEQLMMHISVSNNYSLFIDIYLHFQFLRKNLLKISYILAFLAFLRHYYCYINIYYYICFILLYMYIYFLLYVFLNVVFSDFAPAAIYTIFTHEWYWTWKSQVSSGLCWCGFFYIVAFSKKAQENKLLKHLCICFFLCPLT